MAAGVNAQNAFDKQKKTCITIHENINGKEINIDTCYTGTNAAMEKRLADLGITDLDGNNTNMIVDADDGNGKETKTEVVVIKQGGDDEDNTATEENIEAQGSGNSRSYAYSYSINNDSEVTVSDGKDGGDKVVVKNSNGTVTVTTSSNNKNAKVYVTKKVIVKDISDADKKMLPADVSAEGATFTDLKMSPNPSDGTVTINYTSTSDAPLQIDVYDINGKKIHTETVTDMKGQVSKTLSLNSYGQGIYFVHLAQGNQSETRKVIVK